jgi:DNA-binding beta-propeller fold protein YncE
MRMRSRRWALALAVTVSAATTTAAVSTPIAAAAAEPRAVVLVGNSHAGTVTYLDGATFQPLGTIDVAADYQQRLAAMDPIARAGHELVVSQLGAEHLVDDVYTSPDGARLYVSRGTLNDVVAYDVASGRQIWRFGTTGFKADHAALSPDGTRLTVSATTGQVAQVLNTANGAKVAEFRTGTYPHSNDYSADGKYLYNSSIGITSLPKALNGLKGDKLVTMVDAKTFAVIRTFRFDLGIRPAVFSADNTTMYAQLSYLNGFIKYDLRTGKTVKTVEMPYSDAGRALKPDNYPQNSAHHGMAISGDEAKLCAVGTIDDYTAIVRTSDLGTQRIHDHGTGSLPYWSTTSADGKSCLVSLAAKDRISVISYATGQETASIPVGDYPQRTRLGTASPAAIAGLS